MRSLKKYLDKKVCHAQKHFEFVLDSKLIFNDHIKHILSKVNKLIGSLRKSQLVFPRLSILTI